MATTLPRSWTLGELDNVLTNIERLDRSRYIIDGLPAAAWWEAFARLSWDTALRVGDILNLEFANIATDGTLLITQQKNEQTLAYHLSPATLAAIERIRMSERARILPWKTRLRFGRCYRRLFRSQATTGREGGVA